MCSKFYVSRSQIKPLPTKPPSALHLLVSLAPVLLNQQLGSPRRTALARYLLLTLQKIISSNSLSSLTFPHLHTYGIRFFAQSTLVQLEALQSG